MSLQETWRLAELPSPLETEALVQQNLSTHTELEAWVEAQKARILEEKRADQLQAQEHTREADEAQRQRETLQIAHQKLAGGASSHCIGLLDSSLTVFVFCQTRTPRSGN
jgi:hypothetical protein